MISTGVRSPIQAGIGKPADFMVRLESPVPLPARPRAFEEVIASSEKTAGGHTRALMSVTSRSFLGWHSPHTRPSISALNSAYTFVDKTRTGGKTF